MEPSVRIIKNLWRCFEASKADRTATMLCALARRGMHDPLALFHDHPLADEWRDFAHAAVAQHLRKRKGIVYVVANPVNVGFYKIGVTAFDVNKRLRSLRSAGVVGEFFEVDKAFALDRFAAEVSAHRKMAAIAPRHKEFFVTDHKTASDAMRASVQQDNAVLEKAFRVTTGGT